MALGARRIEAEVPNCTKATRIEADSGCLYIIYMYKYTYIYRYIDMDIGIYIYNHILPKNIRFFTCV